MKSKIQLREYLLQNFFITLTLIGIGQLIINLILVNIFNPLIDETLSLGGLLTSTNIRETYVIIFKGIIIIFIKMFYSSVASEFAINEILKSFFDENLISAMNVALDRVSGLQIAFFLIKATVLFLLVLFVWLLPYLIGGFAFAKIINKKVNEIEENRIQKEREYERKRNLLLSDLAHDIKTPITTIVGFSKALQDKTVKKENVDRYLDALYVKAMQISDLINLLFEYVKLDSAGYKLNKTTENICEVLRGSVARLYTDFEEHEMPLEINIPEENIFCQVDKTQMERAINNLLVNAIKHNPDKTRVEVSLTLENKVSVISISDSGEQIDRETATSLFDPFVQGDKSRASGRGNGLGLSIAKKIVEMHGGQLRLIQYKNVEKYGKSKTFEIKLPIIRA